MSTLHHAEYTIRPLAAVLLVFTTVGIDGCRNGPRKRPGPTQSDRLMQAYPELHGGRFAVVADFEDPSHMELIQFISTSPEAECELSRKGGRPDTGPGRAS